MKQYDLLMKKCIELAKQAQGETSPNPLVGCIVLNDIGEIISTGYHKKYGENHAERDALLKLDDAKNCTLIVNLEPCSHYGKTPPCADLIIEKGVKRVVYGMKDVNPIVAGNGLKKLIDAGIEVQYLSLRDNELVPSKGFEKKKSNSSKQDEELNKEIKKAVAKTKSNKVKPGYKKKVKEAVEKAKRQHKRKIIKDSIRKQRVERYKQEARENKYGK